MTEKIEFNAVEQSFCHRLVSLASMTTERAIKENRLPVTVEQQQRCVTAIGNAAVNLILQLRGETNGMSQQSQDQWVGLLVQQILLDVWKFDAKPDQLQALN